MLVCAIICTTSWTLILNASLCCDSYYRYVDNRVDTKSSLLASRIIHFCGTFAVYACSVVPTRVKKFDADFAAVCSS